VSSYSSVGFSQPPPLSLLSLPSSSHYHPCLSHSCPHLMFSFLQIHHRSVAMSSFLLSYLARFHVTLIYSPLLSSSHFELVRCLLYHHPLSNLVHVNVIRIHSTTLRMCMSMFRSSNCPGLIVILPTSLLLPLVHVLFIGLVSIIAVVCVSYRTCACFHFCCRTPHTINLRFSLHPLPLSLLRPTDSVHILRVTFHSPSSKLTPSLYTVNHPDTTP